MGGVVNNLGNWFNGKGKEARLGKVFWLGILFCEYQQLNHLTILAS